MDEDEFALREVDIMGVSNPAEAVVGILALIDQVRAKLDGTKLAAIPWRPASPDSADDLADLAHEALQRCDDVTEALIAVTVAATTIAQATERRSAVPQPHRRQRLH